MSNGRGSVWGISCFSFSFSLCFSFAADLSVVGDSCFSFSFCFCFAADFSSMEDEEAILLLWGRCLERRVDGGVERMFGLGFLGVGVEVEGVFAVETGSGGGEGVVGRWKNEW